MRQRRGYTLIELMVSITLVMFIMSILATAFSIGLGLFSKVKGVGDLNKNLWAASNQLRKHLSADHFEGGVRLSDANTASLTWKKPAQGFFRVQQFVATPASGTGYEGTQDGFPSARVGITSTPPKPGHVLHFTVRLKGSARENFFATTVPSDSVLLTKPTTFSGLPDARYQDSPPLFTSQWAEVAYYLAPQPLTGTQDTTDGSIKRYSLHKVVRLLVVNNAEGNAKNYVGPDTSYNGVSTKPSNSVTGYTLNFNTPTDVTTPNNRSIDLANPPSTMDNVLIGDVLSFQVQVIPTPGGPDSPSDLPAATPPVQGAPFGYPLSPYKSTVDGTSKFPDFKDLTGGVYESSSGSGGILGLQITIRVWDAKSRQTRQLTMIQDL